MNPHGRGSTLTFTEVHVRYMITWLCEIHVRYMITCDSKLSVIVVSLILLVKGVIYRMLKCESNLMNMSC